MGTTIRTKLAKRIKQLRTKKGLTQERFAELADIDYKYVQRIESKNPPALKVDTIERIAKALGVSVTKLFDR
jgi:transcriptional regulator with XRE-family HTH domain